jgi:hypothetical protein
VGTIMEVPKMSIKTTAPSIAPIRNVGNLFCFVIAYLRSVRTRLHKYDEWIFEHNFVDGKAKSCRNAFAFQMILTQPSAKFAKKPPIYLVKTSSEYSLKLYHKKKPMSNKKADITSVLVWQLYIMLRKNLLKKGVHSNSKTFSFKF